MGIGRPPTDTAKKALRGTLRADRERARAGHGSTLVEAEIVAETPVERDYVGMATGYVDDVLGGRIVACQWVVKACWRFLRHREKYGLSEGHVTDVCRFVEALPHVEGKWETETIRLEPWQVFILAAVYGFRDPETGGRVVTTVFFQVARKSAKSTLVAAMALYHMAKEDEPGAQVVCGASTGQQARLVFGIMQRMVKRSIGLRNQGFVSWAHAVTFRDDGSAKPINAKSSTQDGLNPSFISLDESHAQDFGLHDVLKSAQGGRGNPLLCAPTTAGYDLTSVGYALRSMAMKILDRVIESDHTFVALYELDEGDDWRDEAVWRKAAPMIGISPTLPYVRKYCADAQATPSLQGEFETKMCNRWLSSSQAWLSMAAWDRCADPSLTLEDFHGEKCWIGVDLAERDDIAAVALVFRRQGKIVAVVRGYLPALVVADRARGVPEYRQWVANGELVTTPGNMTDYPTIEVDIRGFCKLFDVQAIVIERYGALNVAANLSNSGLPAYIESKNPKVFTPPSRELETAVKAGQFLHSGSTFLKWQASNVCVERRRDGSLLPMKDTATSLNKIDAIDAILLAMSRMIVTPSIEQQQYQVMVFGGARA